MSDESEEAELVRVNALPLEWRLTPTGPEAKWDGVWHSVNGSPEVGVTDIRFEVKDEPQEKEL